MLSRQDSQSVGRPRWWRPFPRVAEGFTPFSPGEGQLSGFLPHSPLSHTFQDHLGHASPLMTLRYLSTLQEEDSLRIQQDVEFD